MRPGVRGEREIFDADCAVIWPGRKRGGEGLDRYEPINFQIGHPDLVSVVDSLKDQGAGPARGRT